MAPIGFAATWSRAGCQVVAIEIVGVVILIGVLFALSERGPSVVLHTTGWEGSGTYLYGLAGVVADGRVRHGGVRLRR
ncbi:hypothetical protein [Cryptosporangium sp. NPDC048952]|uniref:hypothetical protein n=1 Tax=Cryptosporangium sp. NPDC048952 TaxID=3363961 RepID=UPI003711E74E